jgi:phosphoenolpyruvate-protein kinase (PTS system EI component)
VHIHVYANVALPDDIDYAHKFGADGIGLVRSEFLFFQNKKLPQFNEQVEYYNQIFTKSKSLHPIIRILDIGGDKIPTYMKIPKEFNPYMGWRGIRFLLKKKELFEEHLSAIMSAAVNIDYSLMIPMVSTFNEWKEAKGIIYQIAHKLKKPVPKIGILFEVPLALLDIKNFLPELDFASIGTNDLIQYLLAADRNNANVSYLHNPIDISFLNIIHNAILTAKRAGKPISICGEIAGNPLYTVLLLGLGLTRFSITPHNIPIIKEIISRVSFTDVQEKVIHLLRHSHHSDSTKKQVYNLNKELLDKFYHNFKTYFELIENSDV